LFDIVWRRSARQLVVPILLGVVGALAGCTSSSGERPVVTFISKDVITAPAASSAPSATVIGVDDVLEVTYLKQYPSNQEYRFDVGDVLELQFYTRTELPQSYTVQPDGRIYLPELGYLTVRGLTAGEIEAQIRKGYARTRLAGPVNVVARTTDAKVNEMITTLSRSSAGPTRSVRVLPDGTITLPLLDLVHVGGRTLADVQEDVNARYAREFNNLHVSIELREENSRRFGVMGEVNAPGIFPFIGQTTLMEALSRAGGLRDTAKTYNILIFRPRAKGVEVTEIDTGSDAAAVSMLANWKVEPSDTVYVPKSTIANIDQFIRQYIRDALPIPASGYIGTSTVLQ
jgi:polysaccharide export outer membrane protein